MLGCGLSTQQQNTETVGKKEIYQHPGGKQVYVRKCGNINVCGWFEDGVGGIQHCLIPAPKHVVIDRDKSDNEYYTRLFAKEQSYRSMLRILGY